MSWYYVDSNHGTATTGDHNYETLQTGNITGLTNTTVYTDIQTCLDNAVLADGDTILITDNHSFSQGASTSTVYDIGNNLTIFFVSVDNTAIQTYKKATTFQEKSSVTTGYDWTVGNSDNGRYIFEGVFFDLAGDDFQFNDLGISVEFYDSTFNISSVDAGSIINLAGDGNKLILKDTELNFGNQAGQEIILSESVLIMDGVTSTGTAIDQLIGSSSGSGGCVVKIRNTRLDQLIATNGELFETGSGGMEFWDAQVDNCTLPTGFSLWEGGIPSHLSWYRIDLNGCDQANGYFNDYHAEIGGVVEQDTVQYLTTGATYDGTNEFSLKFTAAAAPDCSAHAPLRYPIAVLPAQDLSSATTFKVELSSTDAGLTDTEVWIEVEVQDSTALALGKVYTTTRNTNPLAAGTGLTSSSGVWADTGNTEYSITSSSITETNATNTTVTIYACVGLAAAVVNFDSAVVVA